MEAGAAGVSLCCWRLLGTSQGFDQQDAFNSFCRATEQQLLDYAVLKHAADQAGPSQGLGRLRRLRLAGFTSCSGDTVRRYLHHLTPDGRPVGIVRPQSVGVSCGTVSPAPLRTLDRPDEGTAALSGTIRDLQQARSALSPVRPGLTRKRFCLGARFI